MAKAAKRTLEDAGEGTSPKKIKLASKPGKKRKSEAAQVPVQTSSGPNDEVDFPRGGGTSFTPVEVKTIRAEAQREANEDIFKVGFDYMLHVCICIYLSCPWIGSQGSEAQAHEAKVSPREFQCGGSEREKV